METRKRRVGLIVATALTVSMLVIPIAGVGAAVAPANDNLANAQVITDGYNTSIDTTGATLEVDETLGSCIYSTTTTSPTWSMWYRFTATSTGEIYLRDTLVYPSSPNFMTVYDLTLPATLGSQVACYGGGSAIQALIPVVAGQDYAVQIVGDTADLGDLLSLEYETTGTLSGTVTDQGTGLGLSGISVSALSTNATAAYGSANTGADGTWTMTVPTRDMIVKFLDYAGVYSSEFYDNAADKFTATTITATEGADKPGIDAALTDAGSMSGTITSNSGTPIAGAVVSLREAASPDANYTLRITGADGTYSMAGLAPGDYYVKFSADNYFTEWYDEATHWSTGAVTITITAGVNLVLDEMLLQGGTISGVVTDDLGTPLPDVRIDVYSSDGVKSKIAVTDAAGAYILKAIPAGTYALFADSDYTPSLVGDHASQWWNGLPPSTAYADVGKITVSSGSNDVVNFSLSRSRVSGTVTSADDSLPVEGVVVTLTESSTNQVAQTTTDVNGNYSFAAFPFSSPPLTVSFEATSVFFVDQTPASFAFAPGDIKAVDAVLAVNQKAPVITTTGVTVDVAENATTGSAVTTLTGTDSNRADTITWSITGGNTGGVFSIDATTGAITTATALDYETTASYTLDVTASDGALEDVTTVTVNVTDVVEPSAISGTVTSSDDTLPIADVVVTLIDGTGTQIDQTTTDAAGNYSFGSFTFTQSPVTVSFEATSVFFVDEVVSNVAIAQSQAKVVDAVLTVDQKAPLIDPVGPLSLPEDSLSGTTVGTMSGIDNNRTDTITWSITGGNAAGAFSIDAGTGAITTATALDYETTPSYTLEVTASDGARQSSTTITIEVTDVDETIPSADFIDTVGSVFKTNIDWMAYVGITKGCNPSQGNTKFCPTGYVTRGQMAAFLVRALKLTDRLDNPFTDDDGSIFEADIEKLAAAGITKGCNPSEGNTRFCPDAKVTRGQMAAFLVRAMGYVDAGAGNLFIDDDGSIFEKDIDKLATAGVTKGCNPSQGNTKFCPSNYVTRGQMAAFLYRALSG